MAGLGETKPMFSRQQQLEYRSFGAAASVRRSTFAVLRRTSIAALLLSISLGSKADAEERPTGTPGSPAVAGAALEASGNDPVEEGFRNPPAAARPYVWWHWMNGNVTADGARLDLEWMKRAGIGGVQLFEGNLFTPQLVAKRLVWMSPDWQQALRESVATANRLGLEFGIATSPGWSSTGAPFVAPDEAMKKLVWSETRLRDGRHSSVRLPSPPSVAGPFQDIASSAELAPFYRDTVVLAFPDAAPPTSRPVAVMSSAGTIDQTSLVDGKFGPSMPLPYVLPQARAWVLNDYGTRVTMRSVTVGIPGARGFGAPPAPTADLEASDDGRSFRSVATLPPSASQVRSVAFAPITARYFRLTLSASPPAPQTGPAGVVPLSMGPPPPLVFALSEFDLHGEGRVSQVEEKSGFAAAADYYAIATTPDSVSAVVRASQVLDITEHMAPDGVLDWRPPAGRWTVLRFGYSLTGHQNGPAPAEATGLEVDKLDAAAVRRYAETYLDRYREALAGTPGLGALLSDSIEAGAQNWTPGMIADFGRLRGYDPIPWLPVLTGRIVESAERSDRFLWDFRQTIADLLARNHYGTLAAVAKERGLTYYAEALEDHRPQLGDDLAMRTSADVPMGAMWTIPAGAKPRQTFVADLQGAASVAHVYGKPLVAAESFTAFGAPWGFSPRDLKATADAEFALGINRIMIHTSPHQPFLDREPGMSLAPLLGQYFSRTETWGAMARGWTDYLARSSYLLQSGRPAADIAYFAGEEAPITGLYGDSPLVLPQGYSFDFLGADAVRDAVSVDTDGTIKTTGGMRYSLIALGGSSRRMTQRTLERLRDLVAAGATISGRAPIGSPSLADDPGAFRAVVDQLWGAKSVYRGRVFSDPRLAVEALARTPDWQLTGAETTAVAVLKRQLDHGALWFVSNRSGNRLTAELSLRLTGYAPEFWFADTGAIVPASYRVENGRTIVPLDLDTDAAVFVVLRRRSATLARKVAPLRSQTLATIGGRWLQSFPQQGDMASFRTRAPLGSWAAADRRTHYFSGTGTYLRDFVVRPSWQVKGRRFMLDLGDVREIAEVNVNDRPIAITWKPPFIVDVTEALKTGRNRIGITVSNLWVNRLIGDAQPNVKKVTFTNGPSYTAEAPMRPSGLLGPVRLTAIDDD